MHNFWQIRKYTSFLFRPWYESRKASEIYVFCIYIVIYAWCFCFCAFAHIVSFLISLMVSTNHMLGISKWVKCIWWVLCIDNARVYELQIKIAQKHGGPQMSGEMKMPCNVWSWNEGHFKKSIKIYSNQKLGDNILPTVPKTEKSFSLSQSGEFTWIWTWKPIIAV